MMRRQPQWSPDSKSIAFFGYRDGGYDLWEVNADGNNQHMLTEGTFDDREPIFSHDGSKIAFSSDRGNPLGSNNNIWIMDVKTDALTQLTTNPAEDVMPAWSADDKEDHLHLQPRCLQDLVGRQCRDQGGAQDRHLGRQYRSRVDGPGRPDRLSILGRQRQPAEHGWQTDHQE